MASDGDFLSWSFLGLNGGAKKNRDGLGQVGWISLILCLLVGELDCLLRLDIESGSCW